MDHPSASSPGSSDALLGELEALTGLANDKADGRGQVEARLAMQNRLLELVARGTSLPDMLRSITRAIELLSPGMMASVLLLDDAGLLHVGAGDSLPPAYNALVEGLPIGPTVGSCGAAAYWKRMVVVTDINTHPNWIPYQDFAKVLRLQACWSGPILSSEGRVLGTLAMYYKEPRAPTEHELHLIETMAHIASVAMEKARAEQERERLLALERQARREAESASRMKDEFLSTLSHELRTPLTSILGWAQLLRTREMPEDKRQRALATIERNARAQTQLIEDLLDISRIVTGKLRLDVRPLEPLPVLEAALDAVRPAAEARGVRLSLSVAPGVGPLSVDAERLQQVVWNLLTNAIKFTPSGGQVVVRLEQGEGEARLEVEDTGQGIAPSFLPHVFERFRQADSSSTRSHGGLGLGLAIVRHLVEMHGGTVFAHSDGPGRGATFRVTFPHPPPCAPEPSPSTQARPEQGARPPEAWTPCLEGLHILVVEDEPDTLALLSEVLEGCRAQVIRAASTREALALLGSLRPDVLVSDIGMAGEDGYSLIRQLRAQERERNEERIPAVAFTAFARSEDRRRALAAGFDVHLAKPLNPSQLLSVVASIAPQVLSRRYRSSSPAAPPRG
ncbi:hybrid sensor histidine kinase/response regulator [Archangium lipolyticum]|uniref:hybrid sensor histidine kinase/response regulator n=1 Tax=Archangium lipolyticum TaxID=2970465 RepID=UPI002149D68F|nr:ATP-binding protein [Archangium lipolyticum]